MKNRIIQLFLFLLVFSLLVSSVSAFEKSSQFLMPYLVDGRVYYEYNELKDKLQIPHVQVCIKNTRTNYEKCVESNDKGYFLVDLRSMLVNHPSELSYMYGDVIEVWINKNDIRQFQIGSEEMCKKAGGDNCNILAKANGGHPINFNAVSSTIIIYKGEEIEAKSWYDEYRNPIAIIGGMILILAAAMVALYHRDKSKYRWMPGMAGILKWNLKNWIKEFNAGNFEEADKIRKTIYKTADTITRKYIRSVEDGTIEPDL